MLHKGRTTDDMHSRPNATREREEEEEEEEEEAARMMAQPAGNDTCEALATSGR